MCIRDSLGPGLLLTSLNVKYRDFRYIIPFVVQFGLYLSPAVSYTHLRAHETVLDLVCRLLLDKKKTYKYTHQQCTTQRPLKGSYITHPHYTSV